MTSGGGASGPVLERAAHAKINLVLDLLGPRDDGYTEIATIFQTVALCDGLRVRLAERDGPVRLAVDGEAPCPPEQNLAVVAAERFRDATGWRGGVEIELVKRIPAGAGLGGGSSDAAAVLGLLNEALGGPLRAAELGRLAAGIGADVAYFLVGGLALGEGRGERLTVLPDLPEWPVVLARAGPPLSTAEVYRASRAGLTPRGDAPNILRFLQHLRAGTPGLPPLWNGLTTAAAALRPEVASLSNWLAAAGGHVGMSGSGSAVFALFTSPGEARAAAARVADDEPQAWVLVTRTVPRAAVRVAGGGGSS